MNFASRAKCHECQSPKEVGMVTREVAMAMMRKERRFLRELIRDREFEECYLDRDFDQQCC